MAEASKTWGVSEVSKASWQDSLPPTQNDTVIFDYWNNCKHNSRPHTTFDIQLYCPDSTKVQNIIIRNFSDFDKKINVHGILRSMKPNQELDIRGNLIREMNLYEGGFEFGVSSWNHKNGLMQLSIKIGGDIVVGKSDINSSCGGALFLGANGDAFQDAFGGPKKVLVEGNVNLYGAGELHPNVGDDSSSNEADNDQNCFKVNGIVTLNPIDAFYPIWITNCRNRKVSESTKPLNAVVKIGGLEGNGVVKNNTKDLGGSSTIVFTNPQNRVCVFSGRIQDDAVIGGKSTVNIVMDGDGAQYLRKSMGDYRFTGGITVERGMLFLNSSQPIGDVLLKGGMIGTTAWDIESAGNLVVNNFECAGGTIMAILEDAGNASLIEVRGNFSATAPVKFNFVLKSYVLLGKYKIIAWEKKPNIENTQFSSNNLGEIKPVFEVASDGLYVTFVKR